MAVQHSDQKLYAVINLAAQVRQRSAGTYRVPSQSEAQVWHTVVFDRAGRPHCSCLAALHGRSCVHLAAVLYCRAKQAEQAAASVVKPAPVPPIRRGLQREPFV